jgi:hypothetical protein
MSPTLQVQHVDGTYSIYQEKNGQRGLFATIKPASGRPGVYVWTDSKGKTETIDLADALRGFDALDLRSAVKETMTTKDGIQIRPNRSGPVSYLKAEVTGHMYPVHQTTSQSLVKHLGARA